MGETRKELSTSASSRHGALENSARLRSAKREIARILTVKTERERLGKI
jgi:ribosomal protein L29